MSLLLLAFSLQQSSTLQLQIFRAELRKPQQYFRNVMYFATPVKDRALQSVSYIIRLRVPDSRGQS